MDTTPSPEVSRVTDRTTIRPVARTCAWCGREFTLRPQAARQLYCGRGCRQRAYEVRTAAARQEDAVAAGRARPAEEPVREVVERVVVRSQVIRIPPPPPPPPRVQRVEVKVPVVPTKARAVEELLDGAAAAVADGLIAAYDHQRVYRGVSRLLAALDAAHPGGLDALMRRR
jgi:hypothetical protein